MKSLSRIIGSVAQEAVAEVVEMVVEAAKIEATGGTSGKCDNCGK